MNRLKSIVVASCFGLASFAVVPSALADTWNKKTVLTINEPVQVPGAILQPGKYVMKLLDSPSNRHIVQIFNESEDQLQTTILAIPNYRLQPTGDTKFQFWETPAGQPKAMRAWFYHGDNFGQEFAYPKNTAVQIAQYSNQNVPAVPENTQAETAPVTSVNKSGEETQIAEQTPPPARAPEPQAAEAPPAPAPQQEVAQNQAPPAAAPAPAPQQLPTTGSPFPLVGISGFLALGASIAVRAISKRTA
jgi:hypothetical protein